eukprot:14118788-Alexandrium_andersonii.AAC.1
MPRRRAGCTRPARPSVPRRLPPHAVGRWRGCWRSWSPRRERASGHSAPPRPWPHARGHLATSGMRTKRYDPTACGEAGGP